MIYNKVEEDLNRLFPAWKKAQSSWKFQMIFETTTIVYTGFSAGFRIVEGSFDKQFVLLALVSFLCLITTIFIRKNISNKIKKEILGQKKAEVLKIRNYLSNASESCISERIKEEILTWLKFRNFLFGARGNVSKEFEFLDKVD